MAQGYEVRGPNGERGWWDGKKVTQLDDNGLPMGIQLGSGQGAPKLTEDQGKAQTFGRLMANAEESYVNARQDGYDPGSPRNTVASILEGLPFGGLDGMGAAVRDDVGDRGRQAELLWSDSQLKAMSGAASPEEEVKRNVKTYFPRPGESMANMDPQKEGSRRTAFDAARIRSGPAGEAIRGYGTGKVKPKGWTAQLPHPQLEAAKAYAGSRAPGGTAKNPSVPADAAEYAKLPPRTYYIDEDGSLKRKP